MWTEFFAEHARLSLTLHLAGVAVGMGGATITDILFFNFLRDYRISPKEVEVMHVLSRVIMAALVILYLSGAALVLSDPARFGSSPAFLAKAAILVILTVNGVLMHALVAPHMVHLSFRDHPQQARREMRRLRMLAFAMGSVSLVSWYSVFLIAMLKSYFPAGVTALHIVGVYAVAVCCAVAVSQVLRVQLHRRSKQ